MSTLIKYFFRGLCETAYRELSNDYDVEIIEHPQESLGIHLEHTVGRACSHVENVGYDMGRFVGMTIVEVFF
jgi:hypothetical protein